MFHRPLALVLALLSCLATVSVEASRFKPERRSIAHQQSAKSLVARAEANKEPKQTKLQVHHDEYRKFCEQKPEPGRPCFTFWSGDLKNVNARIYGESDIAPGNKDWFMVDKNILVKDDSMKGKFFYSGPKHSLVVTDTWAP